MTNSLKPLDFGKGLTPLDKALAELEAYQPSEPSLNPKPEPSPSPAPIQDSNDIQGSYILMSQTDTYAEGVHNLREACQSENNQAHPKFTRKIYWPGSSDPHLARSNGSKIYRPLSFKENLQARVEDYGGHFTDDPERLRLFGKWIDSCCGVAYKKGTSRFKLIPVCAKLVTLDKDFDSASLPINYSSLQGVELDKDDAKYRQLLTKDEVLNHPAWLAAVEEDKALLKAYADIIFNEIDGDRAMGFWPLDSWNNDQLRALFVNNLDKNSIANGNVNLNCSGSFLRVAP